MNKIMTLALTSVAVLSLATPALAWTPDTVLLEDQRPSGMMDGELEVKLIAASQQSYVAFMTTGDTPTTTCHFNDPTRLDDICIQSRVRPPSQIQDGKIGCPPASP